MQMVPLADDGPVMLLELFMIGLLLDVLFQFLVMRTRTGTEFFAHPALLKFRDRVFVRGEYLAMVQNLLRVCHQLLSVSFQQQLQLLEFQSHAADFDLPLAQVVLLHRDIVEPLAVISVHFGMRTHFRFVSLLALSGSFGFLHGRFGF